MEPNNKARILNLSAQDWASSLGAAILLGLLIVFLYGWLSGPPGGLITGLLLAGACLVVGALIGFLFGIPRSLQSETTASEEANGKQELSRPRVQYRANTNLEQISDWLTKILVGVGLTQLVSLSSAFSKMGNYFGSAIGSPTVGPQIAVTIVVFFSSCGFLFGYLWTRLFLGGELAKADLSAVAEKVRVIEQAQEAQEEQAQKQAQIDARAISLVTQYLGGIDKKKVPIDELKSAVEKASPPVKVQLFYQAQELRSSNWQRNEDKPLLERTIPIFEALIASDEDHRFHQNHAQLAYVLKDKRRPDYARAESEFNTAIEIRGPAREEGWEIYEFNRAICLIKQDVDFAANKPSTPERRAKILADLRVAAEAFSDLMDETDIKDWLRFNDVTDLIADPS